MYMKKIYIIVLGIVGFSYLVLLWIIFYFWVLLFFELVMLFVNIFVYENKKVVFSFWFIFYFNYFEFKRSVFFLGYFN